jgi:hypothetical protein
LLWRSCRPLLIRCEANLLKKVPDGRMRNAEAIREKVLLSSFGLMFAEDSTEGHQDEIVTTNVSSPARSARCASITCATRFRVVGSLPIWSALMKRASHRTTTRCSGGSQEWAALMEKTRSI